MIFGTTTRVTFMDSSFLLGCLTGSLMSADKLVNINLLAKDPIPCHFCIPSTHNLVGKDESGYFTQNFYSY